MTLNYAMLLPWKPLTTYYCRPWQIHSTSFSLMSVIRKTLLCQTKVCLPSVLSLTMANDKWLRKSVRTGQEYINTGINPNYHFGTWGVKSLLQRPWIDFFSFFLGFVTFWTCVINQNGIIAWFSLQETSGGLYSDLLLKAGLAMRSDQDAQVFIQLGLHSL